ncbi:hypothetical protein ACH5RR_041350 [Cinchona calisaya]|uniref:Major facilitator superfamily (MFS) profile domain-containing protein n=1 Tax=Cinchona calisaya TaxID=153742 RepID=A0ABD2XYR3_9GENT
MTDSYPFLSPSDDFITSRESAEGPLLMPKTSSLDDTIEHYIGDFGWKQFLRTILISIAWAFDGQQSFISIFTDAEPTWHCVSTPQNQNNSTCSSNSTLSSVCVLPKDAWSWDASPYTSTISEWSLQCAGSFLTGLPASSFFIGSLAGGFLLATLADSSLGRKNLLVLSCLIMSLSGILTALVSTNVWIYAALRFLTGFGRATINTCALVLSTELVGKRWRAQVGIIGFVFFTLGFLSLPLIGYLNRGSSWRLLYIWTCVPPIFHCILVHLYVSESPRWLYVRGRKEEFIKTLKGLAAREKPNLTSSFFGTIMGFEENIEDGPNFDFYSTMKTFWERKWAFRRLMAVMAIGFGTGMVYYGMPLGLGSLSFNLYLSVSLNALAEFPSSLITFLLVGKLNRKELVLGFAMASGICSIICAFYSKWKALQISLEMFSFFSACTAFNVLLIYTLELFPTCVRNSALSMVRQAVVLGGAFSPVLVAVGRNTKGLLSYGVFGVTIAVSGLFVGCLPETKGDEICDTLEEEEQKEIMAARSVHGLV